MEKFLLKEAEMELSSHLFTHPVKVAFMAQSDPKEATYSPLAFYPVYKTSKLN